MNRNSTMSPILHLLTMSYQLRVLYPLRSGWVRKCTHFRPTSLIVFTCSLNNYSVMGVLKVDVAEILALHFVLGCSPLYQHVKCSNHLHGGQLSFEYSSKNDEHEMMTLIFRSNFFLWFEKVLVLCIWKYFEVLIKIYPMKSTHKRKISRILGSMSSFPHTSSCRWWVRLFRTPCSRCWPLL